MKDNQFQITLNMLIDVNHRLRETLRQNDIHRRLSPAQYAYEYGTVRCDVGRQTGKTTWIFNNATEKDLIIVPNMRNYRHYLHYTDHLNIVTIDSLNSPIVNSDIIYDNIYIDDFKVICDRDVRFNMEFIYNILARNDEQTFILLG